MLQAAALSLLFAQAQSTAGVAVVERAAEQNVKVQPTAGNWQKLGLARFMQNRFPDAIGAFRQAIARDAGLWPSHLFLGMSLYRTNRFEEALHSPQNSKEACAASGARIGRYRLLVGSNLPCAQAPLERGEEPRTSVST